MAEAVTAPAPEAPRPKLDEVMLAMDVVDTLRHQETIVERELSQEDRDAALKTRLRRIYESQGLEVSDRILDQGIVALRESRFTYTPPPPGFGTFLARMWVRRRSVGSALGILIVVLVLVIGWQWWSGAEATRQAEAQRIELTETLPAEVERAGATALAAAETAEARAAAERLIAEGETAVAAGDGQAMRAAIASLEALRASLLQTYTLTIVSRPNEDTGVFRIPDVNEAARNYYIIVEARAPSGEVLPLPVRNEEDGQVTTVSKWGVRVPQATFEAVRADKTADGIVDDNILGEKRRGALSVEYLMDVEDGAIVDW